MDGIATKDRYFRLETGVAKRYPRGADTYKGSSNLVQGTVAEIMRIVLQSVAPKLREIGAYIILQIHDSFMIEIPEGKEHAVKKMIGYEFAQFRFAPNLISDGKAGKRWSELQKIEDV